MKCNMWQVPIKDLLQLLKTQLILIYFSKETGNYLFMTWRAEFSENCQCYYEQCEA